MPTTLDPYRFADGAPRRRLEAEVTPNRALQAWRFLRRLPEVRRGHAGAEELTAAWPDPAISLELPSQGLLERWITELCATPHRRVGTPEGHRGEQWVAARMRELGLHDVALDPIGVNVWQAARWALRVTGADVPAFYLVNTAFTPAGGLSAPLAYVGHGRARDFARADVRGKIVVGEVPYPYIPTGLLLRGLRATGALYAVTDTAAMTAPGNGQYLPFVRENFMGGTPEADSPPNDIYWNAVRNGAAGVCLILADQPTGSNSHYGPYDGLMKPIPGLWIGRDEGPRLRALAKRGERATLRLEGTCEPGVTHNVWGVLPGASDEVVLVTSHHDAPFLGAVEDAAGIAQVLGQAHAWSRVPQAKRPRTLVFVADTGHFYGSIGAHTFAHEHADLMRRTKLLITLEHLAGREVREDGTRYVPTGNQALTVMFTSSEAATIATAQEALRKAPAKRTAAVPAHLLAPVPVSDAAGYVLEAGVPVISWIGCPYYLLDEHDTLDKLDPAELVPIARTVSELVKGALFGPHGRAAR
jgi:hypothetical protein